MIFIALESVGGDRVDIVGSASFVAVVSATTDAIFVVDVDFVVGCFATFDNVDKWNDFKFTFVELVIVVV